MYIQEYNIILEIISYIFYLMRYYINIYIYVIVSTTKHNLRKQKIRKVQFLFVWIFPSFFFSLDFRVKNVWDDIFPFLFFRKLNIRSQYSLIEGSKYHCFSKTPWKFFYLFISSFKKYQWHYVYTYISTYIEKRLYR